MGYHTRGVGWIDIDPPVPVAILADITLTPLTGRRIEQRTDHGDGSYTIRPVIDRLEPSHEDEWRADPAEVEGVVGRVLAKLPAGHRLAGHIYAEGEENGDVWRVQAINLNGGQRAQFDRAVLSWPDGAKVDSDTEWKRYPW